MFEIPVAYILMGQVFINTILLGIVIKEVAISTRENRETRELLARAIRGFQDATVLLERLLERVLRQTQ